MPRNRHPETDYSHGFANPEPATPALLTFFAFAILWASVLFVAANREDRRETANDAAVAAMQVEP